MAGVRDKVDVNLAAAAGGVFAGGTHVIFHIARAKNAARVDVFESGKDFLGSAPGHVGNDVEAAAMAHSHDEFDGAEAGARVKDFVDQGD